MFFRPPFSGNKLWSRFGPCPDRWKTELTELDSAIAWAVLVVLGLAAAALIAWLTSA